MAKGNGKKKAARRQAQQETAAKGHSRQAVVNGKAARGAVENSSASSSRHVSVDVSAQTSRTEYIPSPIENSANGETSKSEPSREKRDSVISTDWEDAKVMEHVPEQIKQVSRPGRRRTQFRPTSWWPCRMCRWVRMLALAVGRGFQGRRWKDFLIAFCGLLVCLYAAYTALDVVFTGLIKGVNAQDVVEAANCSVIYVTIPGPIITVSLIAASPTASGRGTYYYSVINGTTQWLNSITPPGRSSAFVTQTVASTSGISTPVSVIPPATSIESIPISTWPGAETIFTTTTTSRNVIKISTVTLVSSATPANSIPPGPSVLLPDSARISTDPVAQPSRPYPSGFTSSVFSSPTSIFISTNPAMGTISISASQRPDRTSKSSVSSLWSPGSPGLPSTASSSFSGDTRTGGSLIMPSTVLVITSTVHGGQTTTLTITSTTLIVVSSFNAIPSLETPQLVSSFAVPIATSPSVSTTQGINSGVTPGLTSSTAVFTQSLRSSSSVPTTGTNVPSDEQTSTVLLTSSISVGPTITVSSIVGTTTVFLVTTTTTRPGGQVTISTSTTTIVVSGTTLAQVSSLPSTAFTGSSSAIASSEVFTIPLPDPATGTSGTGLMTTFTRFSSVSISTLTSIASSVFLSGSSSIGPPVSTASFSGTNNPSSSILTQSSVAPTRDSLSLTSTSAPSFPTGATSETLGFPSSSSFITSAISLSTSLRASSTTVVSGSSALSTLSFSSILSFESTASLSSTSRSSVIPTSLSASAASSSLLSTTPAVPTTSISVSPILTNFNTSTHSNNVSITTSSSSLSSSGSSRTGAPVFTTSVLVFNTSSGSTSPSLTIGSSRWSSQSSLGSAGATTLSSLFSLSTSTNSPLPGVESSLSTSTTSIKFSSMSTNTSSPVSSVSLSISTSPGLSTSASSQGLQPTVTLPSAAPIPPRSNSSNATTLSTFSSVSSSRGSTSPVVVITPTPTSDSNSTLEVRALMTRVVSYGDTSVVFVFPTPTIVTTQSYWTGTYPTVTGPEPSDLQTVASTTRWIRQTPLSELPSFELFARPSTFRTAVDTVARAAAIPTETNEAPSSEPTNCGESGNFTLSFDDTSIGSEEHGPLVVNGMKNPYHHLFYANGFTHMPDKWEPFPAISQPNVAMFLPLTGRLLPNTPFAGTLLPGEIGAGPRASVTAYWFNAFSGYFGCALNGLTPCTLRISGYRYDEVLKEEVLVAEQNATLPACYAYVNCQLTQVFFTEQFRALSGIQFNAFTYNLGIPQVYMMDDLRLGWYNNSCAAGIWRIGHL